MEPSIAFDDIEELMELQEKYLRYGQALGRRIDQVRRAKGQLLEMRTGREYGGLAVADRLAHLRNLEGILIEQLTYTLTALKSLSEYRG